MIERELREGDIVIGQGFVNDTKYNDMEGTFIVAVPPQMIVYMGFDHPENCYAVVFQDGSQRRVKRERLRLKRPKEDDKEWAMSKVKSLINEQEFNMNSAKENDLVTG